MDIDQLKKKCKKKDFHGIHDRFIRDQEFRNRMIEHNRDEEVCRRWDALADEDHTHHLTTQEYFYFLSKWWLLNMSLRHRPDFKLALSSLQRLQQEVGVTLTNTNNGRHAVHLQHGGIGKVPGGLLTIQKVKEEASKVLNEP